MLMNSKKSRIHQVFGVWYFVFSMNNDINGPLWACWNTKH